MRWPTGAPDTPLRMTGFLSLGWLSGGEWAVRVLASQCGVRIVEWIARQGLGAKTVRFAVEGRLADVQRWHRGLERLR